MFASARGLSWLAMHLSLWVKYPGDADNQSFDMNGDGTAACTMYQSKTKTRCLPLGSSKFTCRLTQGHLSNEFGQYEGIVKNMPPALLGVSPRGLIHGRAARVLGVIDVTRKTHLRTSCKHSADNT